MEEAKYCLTKILDVKADLDKAPKTHAFLREEFQSTDTDKANILIGDVTQSLLKDYQDVPDKYIETQGRLADLEELKIDIESYYKKWEEGNETERG